MLYLYQNVVIRLPQVLKLPVVLILSEVLILCGRAPPRLNAGIFLYSPTPCQIMTVVYRRRVTGRLEGFGNFGRIHYRIQEGGHLPYEG